MLAHFVALSACAFAHLRLVNSRQAHSIKLAICVILQMLACRALYKAINRLPLGGKLCRIAAVMRGAAHF